MTYWKGRLRRQYLRKVDPASQKHVPILPGSVGTTEIQVGGVTNNNIVNNSITQNKLVTNISAGLAPYPYDTRKGPEGLRGPQGERGSQGPQGAFGTSGPPGVDGSKGEVGYPGPQGMAGPIGPTGNPGVSGLSGPPGFDGAKGSIGEMGIPGPQGLPGLSGSQGLQGVQGSPGRPGIDGRRGVDGFPIIGPTGSRGPQGEKGPPGIDGKSAVSTLVLPPGSGMQGQVYSGLILLQKEVYLDSIPRRAGKLRISKYLDTVLANSPLSYWQLAETGGTMIYDQMRAVHGTLTNPQPGLLIQGQPGVDIRSVGPFSNTNSQFLDFGDNYGFTAGSFSVEFWIYPLNAIVGTVSPFTKWSAGANGWRVWATAAGTQFQTNGSGVNTAASPTVGAWNHVVGVFDSVGLTRDTYVNGVGAGPIGGATQPNVNVDTLKVGGLSDHNSLICAVAIYGSVLSAASISAHYNAGVAALAATPADTKALVGQAASVYTGKGTRNDESQMDNIECRPVVMNDGSIDVYWTSRSFVWKNVKFNYRVG